MSRMRRWVKRGVLLAITGVSIYLIIPSVIATFSSWPELQRLRPGSLAGMAGLTLASLICFWLLLGLCLRTRQWGLMAVSQLASGAIARIVPGGAATATAVQYRLLHEGGIAGRMTYDYGDLEIDVELSEIEVLETPGTC